MSAKQKKQQQPQAQAHTHTNTLMSLLQLLNALNKTHGAVWMSACRIFQEIDKT